jgi:hypothetical protein
MTDVYNGGDADAPMRSPRLDPGGRPSSRPGSRAGQGGLAGGHPLAGHGLGNRTARWGTPADHSLRASAPSCLGGLVGVRPGTTGGVADLRCALRGGLRVSGFEG